MFLTEITNNAAMTANIRAKQRGRLTDADYALLLSKRSIPEIAAYLKHNLRYAEVLKKLDENTVHRAEIEKALRSTIAADFASMRHFVNAKIRPFFSIFALRDEIETLKVYLRLTAARESVHSPVEPPKNRFTKLNFATLLRADSFSDFIELTRGTVYYEILSPFLKNTSHMDLFNLETALDMYYNRRVWQSVAKLAASGDKASLEYTFGTETDLQNIHFILRAKKFYNMPPEQISPYILNHYHSLTREDVKRLINAPDYAGTVEVLRSTRYKRLIPADAESSGKSVSEASRRAYRRIMREHPYSVAAQFTYLHLKELEIKNIITIVEGVRYGFPPEQIREHLLF